MSCFGRLCGGVFRTRTARSSCTSCFGPGTVGPWLTRSIADERPAPALNPRKLDVFLDSLGADYYGDRETAQEALRLARPFNVIHRQLAFKFDLFPIHDEHGSAELERTQYVVVAALDDEPVPIVSAEDIIIAKLGWYRDGGEVSQQQWRDIVGVLRMEAGRIDDAYLDAWTRRLGLNDLCRRARQAAAQAT